VPRAPGGSGSTIPSAARRHPRPSSRCRVCRRGGAASHLRCCPPSTRRTSGAVRVPFHPALRCARYPRPPPLKTTLVIPAGTRGLFAALTTRPAQDHTVRIVRCAHNPPNPTHPGYTGAPHRCSTSASLQPACAKPRTPVRTGKRAVRLPADSAPGFGTPIHAGGPTRTVRFAASSPRVKRRASLPDASLPDAQQERPMAASPHTGGRNTRPLRQRPALYGGANTRPLRRRHAATRAANTRPLRQRHAPHTGGRIQNPPDEGTAPHGGRIQNHQHEGTPPHGRRIQDHFHYWPGPARGRLRERSAALPVHRRCPSPTNTGTLSPW